MRILLAVDGSLSSDAAVEDVARRPWPADSHLKIISAITLPIPVGPDPIVSYVGFRKDLMEAERRRAQSVIDRAVEEVRRNAEGGKLQVSSEVIEAAPKNAIVGEASAWGADLIVMGSHGHGALVGFLLGSVSHAVLNHAPCSVEIVRHGPSSVT